MPTTVALTALASEINAEHEAAERSINESLQHARRCGELLNDAKRQMKHGALGPWLADNFHASRNTAIGYMKIARRWAEIVEANSQRVENLPIREALALLTTPRTNESDPISDPEGSAPEAAPEAPRVPRPHVEMTEDQKRTAAAVRAQKRRDDERAEASRTDSPAPEPEGVTGSTDDHGGTVQSETGEPVGATSLPDEPTSEKSWLRSEQRSALRAVDATPWGRVSKWLERLPIPEKWSADEVREAAREGLPTGGLVTARYVHQVLGVIIAEAERKEATNAAA